MPPRPKLQTLLFNLRWFGLAVVIGILAGAASAAFLLLLDIVTAVRLRHAWLLYCLPLGGFLAGFLYHRFGLAVLGGNNLIIDEFHNPSRVIPMRMAPLVLLGTVITHLVGGSAGREGTAVQMSAALADQLTHLFKFAAANRSKVLMAGMSAGFASVFGVPFAGMVFGIEVLAVGRLHLAGVMQCGIAAFVAHHTTLALGIQHSPYPAVPLPAFEWQCVTSVAAAGLIFGAAARLFGRCSVLISHHSQLLVPYLPMRAALGGALLALLYLSFPELSRYSGLGLEVISQSLRTPVLAYDWLGKLSMTALTLGFGFKGGEVTPLLFIGSTLGNALSTVLPAPLGLLAALGLVGVFAGAANTPITCWVMAMELFGAPILPYAAIACGASYLASSHHGIYHSQRVHRDKRAYIRRTFKSLRKSCSKFNRTDEA